MKQHPLACVCVFSALLLGCGSVDPADHGGDASGGAGGSGAVPEGPLLPWAVGNNWTYNVDKAGVVSQKTTTIGALEAVGGDGPNAAAMAYHVTTAKGADLNDHTESWQTPRSDNPERIVRYREQAFNATSGKLTDDTYWDPEKLHIDGSAEHSVAGKSWLESYAETKLTVGQAPTTHDVRERWTVVEDDATLEVPAGSFEHVIHFQKIGSSNTKDYWYLRGVGKLKETGSQTEELTAYQLKDAP